ncbi:MAG: TetR/AcrR family transcriptional regulator [Alphaproteobacteria bacterium]|nr:TetR/AcrR family transcriptional regulator [Alphaproteobacteria bacterium]
MPAPRRTDDQFMQDLTRLMLREGVSRLTVGQIAARLRCSRRRLYRLAPSKERLFLKIADEMFRSVRVAGWVAARRHETAADRFAAYLAAGIAIVRQTTDAFYSDMDALPAGRALFDSHQRERIAGLETLIEEGIRSGEFAPYHSRVVAEILLSAARRMREPSFHADTGATFEEAFSELSRVLRDGLRRRANDQGARPTSVGAGMKARKRRR